MNCKDCGTIMSTIDNSITRKYIFCPRCSLLIVENQITGMIKFYREVMR